MFGNISFQNKRLEIGWTWIGEKFQGTGINAICKGLLLDYCFDDLNLRRVEFKIEVNNLKSQKAIYSISFRSSFASLKSTSIILKFLSTTILVGKAVTL